MELTTTTTTGSSRARSISFWLATGIIALETGAGAEWDLVRNPFVCNIFNHLGYPLYLLTIIGIWKVLAFIALLIPGFTRLKEWAYAGLFFVYTGAAASHIAAGDAVSAWAGPAVFGAITLVSWYLRAASRRLA